MSNVTLNSPRVVDISRLFEGEENNLARQIIILREKQANLTMQLVELKISLEHLGNDEQDLKRVLEGHAVDIELLKKAALFHFDACQDFLKKRKKALIDEPAFHRSLVVAEFQSYNRFDQIGSVEEIFDERSPTPDQIEPLVRLWSEEELRQMNSSLSEDVNRLYEEKSMIQNQVIEIKRLLQHLQLRNRHLEKEKERLGKIGKNYERLIERFFQLRQVNELPSSAKEPSRGIFQSIKYLFTLQWVR